MTSMRNMNRRQFVKSAATWVGGVAMLGPVAAHAHAQDRKTSARWVFLSDTHIPADPEDSYRDFYPYRNLMDIVPQISKDLPEGVVITGDVARLAGLPGDYENTRRLLSPILQQRPICMALGNHDDRDNFQNTFAKTGTGKQDVQGKHVVVIDTGPVRLLVLDSLLYVNKVAGLLGRAQRRWLESYLQAHTDKPILLCVHHTLSDGDGDLLDVPRLFDIIRPASTVKAILFGHSHVYRYTQMEGIHLINLPAVGYNFSDDQPVGWVDAHLTREGGAFRLHAIGGNTEKDGQETRLKWRV